ncbi:MAG: 5-dehydro-2-deoxygluconokinase [Chloroflexi bacterium]|nr:5-dehydro-2-deoxygluconokinase [Chloroflexota bacterium]
MIQQRDLPAGGRPGAPDAIVMGRVGADLYPQQLRTRLEDVRTFERFVGGFAANVATGLARLEVRVAIVSAVGDEGHGRYVRGFLSDEGVDVRWLATHPTLLTPLAFCEVWPPDDFPITFYRAPSAPDWELRAHELPLAEIAAAPLLYVTGTALAVEPSRGATLAALEHRAAWLQPPAPRGPEPPRASQASRATILDLDWRAVVWSDPAEYGPQIRRAAALVDTVIGGESEFYAAGLEPADALALGPTIVLVKCGGRGANLITASGTHVVAGLPVEVTNGLGAGDAFAAAYGAAMLAGLAPIDRVRRGNAAGAIVATRLGCSIAMPKPAEIDDLLAGARIHDGAVGKPTRAGAVSRT